jgi:uncharacterized membrane protein
MMIEPVLFFWMLFAGTHLGLSSLAVRRPLIKVMGLRGFKSAYTLVALGTFIPLLVVYFRNKHAGPVLFTPGPGVRLLAEALMLVAIVVLAQGLATSSPIGTQADLQPAPYRGPRGIQRITRHPLNLAFGMFGVAHCLANPVAGDWIFFGGFTLFALVSAWHQDARLRYGASEGVGVYLRETSYWPFAAVVSGRQRIAIGEFRPVALLVAFVAYAALRNLHPRLFGGDWG